MPAPATLKDVRSSVDEIFSIMVALGDVDYQGEPVSQLEHCLQCAVHAQNAKADDDTIVAALMHDIGRFIPAADKMPQYVENGKYLGRGSHDMLGERYLRRQGFSEKVCQLVGAHVGAKRYLCSTEPEYHDSLSASSKRTYVYQGGRLTDIQIQEAKQDPWLYEKLSLRRWDDWAKVPKAKTPPLEAYRELAVRCLERGRSNVTLNGLTYQLPMQPTIILCVEGLTSPHLKHWLEGGNFPRLNNLIAHGFQVTAKSAPCSASQSTHAPIVTGTASPSQHSAGRAILNALGDHKNSSNVESDSAECSTLLSLLSERGVHAAAITENDGSLKGLDLGSTVSIVASNVDSHIDEIRPESQRLHRSGHKALFVLDSALRLLEEHRFGIFYLVVSSDWSGSGEEANSSMLGAIQRAADSKIGQFLDLGAAVSITGVSQMTKEEVGRNEEECVPLISSCLAPTERGRSGNTWYNSDIFRLSLN